MALRAVTGFEFDTTAGWVTGNAGNRIFDAVTGAPTIVATSPRSGARCLQIAASAAAIGLRWTTDTLTTSQTRGLIAFGIYLEDLPGADVILGSFFSGLNGEFRYNAGTGKFNIGFEGTGEVQDGPTVAADTWYWVEIHYDVSANPNVIDWWVDGVAQTQATNASGASTIDAWEFGNSLAAQTFTARYDDAMVWSDTADIASPIGMHKVVLLSVDPAGTVTLSGTTGNFNTFTANGTLAAWNATTARNNIDEFPPTIGASADGWVQITLQTTNYVQMPMTSYTLAAGETVAGARMLVPGWATSTTGATIGFRSWNGTTERTLFAAADPNFDNSTTVPAWVCKMLTLADIDTQGLLDALEFRAGFSGDATPDIGIHAIYAELAVKQGAAVTVPPKSLILSQAVNRAYTY